MAVWVFFSFCCVCQSRWRQSPCMSNRPLRPAMAFDKDLVSLTRVMLSAQPGIAKRRMLGGVAVLRNDMMFIGVFGNTLMAKARQGKLRRLAHAQAYSGHGLTGKATAVCVCVDAEDAETKDKLAFWVNRSTSFVATLPPKEAKVHRASPRKTKRAT